MAPDKAIKVHGQLVVIQAVLDDVVSMFQQNGQAQEQHERISFAKLLRRWQGTWFSAGALQFNRTGHIHCGAGGLVAR